MWKIIGIQKLFWNLFRFCICFYSLSLVRIGDCYRWPTVQNNAQRLDEKRWKRQISATTPVEVETAKAEITIPRNYDLNAAPPTVDGKPSRVQLAILIVNVRDIKDLSEELTLEVNLKMAWKDERLMHLGARAKSNNQSFIVIHPETVHKIWHPDIYIDHVKTITQPSIVSKPASLRVYPDGTLRYSARLTLSQACQMDFHYYPADTQHCRVDLMSYGYNDEKMSLVWKEGGASLANKLKLPNVDVGMDTPDTFVVTTSSGRYDGLRVTILLRRKLSYHLLQTYLPSSLFVIVSWQSFLVPADSIPGRMALCMTTLLTLTSMFSSVRQNIPVVSYIKAIDIWMVAMIFFVFLTLLEYTTLLKLKSLESKKKERRKKARTDFQLKRIIMTSSSTPENSSSENHAPILTNEIDTTGGGGRRHSMRSNPSKLEPEPPELRELSELRISIIPGWSPDRIERIASKVIPSLFLFFQVAYWPWLLYKAKYYEQFEDTVYYSSS